jgi:undecaprenyl-diphosphatase
MFWGSKSLIWTPFFLFLFFLVIRHWGWNSIWILIVTALLVLMSDQLANVFKDGFERLRPSHQPGLMGIHLVNGYAGGNFGFYSGHASTTMAIAVYLIILLRSRYSLAVPVMLGWSLFMSYTRIYLGVHYPGDILMGWLMGSGIGFLAGQVCIRVVRRYPIGNRKNA